MSSSPSHWGWWASFCPFSLCFSFTSKPEHQIGIKMIRECSLHKPPLLFSINSLHGKPCKYDTVKLESKLDLLDGCCLLFFLWLLIKFSVMSPRGMLITLALYLQGGLVSKVYIYTWAAGIYLYQESKVKEMFLGNVLLIYACHAY